MTKNISKKFNFLLILITIYVFVCVITKNELLFLGYLPILIVCVLYDFRLGLVAWFLIMPFYSIINVLVMHAYTAIIGIMYIIRLANGKEIIYKNKFGKYLFLLIFIALCSSIITQYFEHFFAMGVFIIYYLLAFIVSQQILKNKENVFLISNAIILSGLMMALVSIISPMTSEELSGRVGIEDNVRPFANAVAFGIVMLLSFYYLKRIKEIKNKEISKQTMIIKRLKWILFFIFIFSLLSTVSRGTIISVSVFILSVFLIKGIKSIINFKAKNLIGAFAIIGFTFVGGFFLTQNNYFNKITSVFNIDTRVFSSRFSNDNFQGGSNIRNEIWKAGFSGLENWEIIYGHGFLSFKDLAKRNGYDFYSHSVFMDTLVTTGILGLLVLILLFINIFVNSIRMGNITAIAPILLFTILNYFTHGDMLATGFWLMLAICSGLIGNQKTTNYS